MTERWTPSRAGILNVWRYYDEVFEFHSGRLLLRGPNGSGKSKALELLLPFLFDASLRANRLSTFGTSERTMHWNLMGEGASGTTRVGYVWLEFQRQGEWFCCGARLQASTHTTTVHPDYFTTSLRIGTPDGITLVNEANQPLTKNALAERLGDDGVVHANASDYRTEVRAVLFPGLSEQRYDALITALLQLRTPKLSQRLDPALLSTLLSRALPPLGQQEISDLAEGFERLDAQRERLATLQEEVTATRALAGRQKTYAQRVLRAGSATVISATTELDNLTRAARRSAEQYEQVAAQKESAETRVAELDERIIEAEARKTGLTESEAYKQGLELARLREQTTAAAEQAARLRASATTRRVEADADRAHADQAADAAAGQVAILAVVETEIRHSAARAGLSSVHTELAGNPDRRFLRAAVQSRQGQIRTVREAVDKHERAIERRLHAEEDLDTARSGLTTATRHLEATAQHREAELSELTSQFIAWMAACRELRITDGEVLMAGIDSEPAVLAVINSAAEDALGKITRQEAITEPRLADVEHERALVSDEVRRLAAHEDIPPLPPPFRTADRARMSGAPLWRLVDFAASVPEKAYAGIEAALEASGLLDAWIRPSGEIQGLDTFTDVSSLSPAIGRSLADVLVAEPDSEIDRAIIQQVLAAVAFDDRLPAGPAAISADGTWRMGALTGAWHKDHAGHIGARTRQRARERRIEVLRSQIADLDTAIIDLRDQLSTLNTRRSLISQERDARPSHAPLIAASQELTAAQADVGAAESVVRHRVGIVSARERDASQALHRLTGTAAENNVPTDRAALTALETEISAFADLAETWLYERNTLISLQRTAETLAGQAQRSDATAREREDEATRAERHHAALAAKLDAIDSTLDVDYREILQEIERLGVAVRTLNSEQTMTRTQVTALAQQLGSLDAQRQTDANVRDEASAKRDAAAHRFRHLAASVFPADSELPDLSRFTEILAGSEGIRAALDAARFVAHAWPNIPHTAGNLSDALGRLLESVHTSRTGLSSRADLDLTIDEDVQVFTAVVDGLRVGAAELLHILRAEADQAQSEITEHERELFDQTLTGDTRRHLAARIRQANELVDGMNARLERVRTASKVAVRLVWQVAPELPPGTKTARDLLLKDPARLTDDDRDSLHRFFRDRIEQAKADDTATSWEQQLAQVFDYTAWHRFVVKVDRANGQGWQLLTKKLHGALSGGEKAIALHLPLFAAVAAHYQAVAEAPRIILLDEVFVGVDTTNRGQVFGLLSELDLDLMLTSDHEWCTYSELAGVGIHQLVTGGGDGDEAVTTARFTWNGQDLLPA
ncbi:TIGR02680 family protein [Kibdelosporangium philippinense]|uniref:TIGR02680 family protein n=1 Tax=Kibdelosporangium philippinense TaxID=211113 RepID=A0ABS8Z7Q3_9PSEU|nr:TIGR02680 family protein [Kibdelosporangium philippinense]MCE7003919.1 TIGR02680 family protein [Kibdelosporangium philippinense]